MKTKRYLLLFIAITFNIMPFFAQNKRLNEGSCKEIVDYLRKLHKDDAVAIEFLKKEYKIINRNADYQNRLFSRHYVNIIKHFDTEEGKDCRCRSLTIDPDVLLYDPPTEGKDKK